MEIYITFSQKAVLFYFILNLNKMSQADMDEKFEEKILINEEEE